MAAKTTLNEKNLAALGAERLAALVMELATGNAALKRQARTALLENVGGDTLATEVRKRLATIKRSTSFVDWNKRPALVMDLHQQRKLIAGKIGPTDPKAALELMWRFMELAESVHNRADDSNGDIGDVFRAGSGRDRAGAAQGAGAGGAEHTVLEQAEAEIRAQDGLELVLRRDLRKRFPA